APSMDRVHRLVLDQLFEHDRGGAPVDALEAQEAAVEPGAQQVQQVRVGGAPLRVRLEALEQLPAHRHQLGGAARCHVEPAEQLLPCRLDAVLQAAQVLGSGLGLVGRRGAADDLGRRSEEHTSELQSRENLVCRLLLEKKKKNRSSTYTPHNNSILLHNTRQISNSISHPRLRLTKHHNSHVRTTATLHAHKLRHYQVIT